MNLFSASQIPEKFFNLLLLSVLLLVLVATTFLVKQKQLLEKKAAGGENARLALESSTTSVEVGQSFEVLVRLNTDEAEVRGIDVILNFPRDRLRLTQIQPTAQINTSLKTFAPVDASGNFNTSQVITRANSEGIIEFAAVTFDWNAGTEGELTNPFNSETNTITLSTLTFKALVQGQATIAYCLCANCGTAYNPNDVCASDRVTTKGVTWDANIVRVVGEDVVDILDSVNKLTINIGSTATTTPTPTPDPAKAQLNFKVKFQGINEPRSSKTVTLTFGQAGGVVAVYENVAIISANGGIYGGTVANITPGTYDILVKGWAHLQKKFTNITLIEGANSHDWSGTALLAGDTWDDNIINALDFLRLVENYFETGENEADLNGDGTVNALDFLPIIGNYFLSGDEI